MHESVSGICGVMVTYHPDDRWSQRLPALLAQLGHLMVVDNSTQTLDQDKIRQACAAYPAQIDYIPCPHNNLAIAQNIGIRAALAKPAHSHVLLLDDDSEPAEGMVQALVDASGTGIGLVAPCMVDLGSNRPARFVVPCRFGFRLLTPKPDEIMDHVLHVIASGSLIPRSTFAQVGWMDEAFVIDYIDKDFCLRLCLAGLRICVVGSAVLHHRLGQCEDHQIAGVRVTATNHSPARRYTIYRNRVWCLRRYGLRIPAFLLHEMGGIAYDLLRIAVFESDKKAKLRSIMRGIGVGLSSPC